MNNNSIEETLNEIRGTLYGVHPTVERIMNKIKNLRNEPLVNEVEIHRLEAELEMVRANLSLNLHMQQIENIAF